MQQHFSVWRMMHPNFLPAGSDKYYEELQKEINDALLKFDALNQLYRRELVFDFVSKMSAGYLEDKASGFGVWDAFVSLNFKRNKKKLPFFKLGKGYDTETINFEDIEFIAWMSVSMILKSDGMVISPLSPFINLIALQVYAILSREWESAPEASRITEYIDSHLSSEDWVKQRSLAEWLTLNCYLTSVPDMLDTIQSTEVNIGVDKNLADYSMRARTAVNSNLRPVGLKAASYLEEMARNAGLRKISKLWNNLKVYDMACYRVDKISDNEITITTEVRYSNDAPLVGEKLSVVIESMSSSVSHSVKEGNYILASFVKWNEGILLNGMMMAYTQVIEDETSKRFNQFTSETIKIAEDKSKRFIELNNGDRFAYFEDWQALYKFFDLSIEESSINRQAPQKNKGLTCYISDNFSNSISFIAGSCLKDPNNPFYNKEEASKPGSIMSLIMSPEGLSYEGAIYAAQHGMLADGNLSTTDNIEEGKKIFADNIYFWIDFYHSQLQ